MHPREIVKLALLKSAAACIVYHNHPSRVQKPSQADALITARVKEALVLIDGRPGDHILGGLETVTVPSNLREIQPIVYISKRRRDDGSCVGLRRVRRHAHLALVYGPKGT